MSSYIWCEIVCATCSVSICGQYTTRPYVPRKSLEKEAVAAGAVFEGKDFWCSATCKKQSDEQGDDA